MGDVSRPLTAAARNLLDDMETAGWRTKQWMGRSWRTVSALQDAGLLECQGDPARRQKPVYRITDAGRAALASTRAGATLGPA